MTTSKTETCFFALGTMALVASAVMPFVDCSLHDEIALIAGVVGTFSLIAGYKNFVRDDTVVPFTAAMMVSIIVLTTGCFHIPKEAQHILMGGAFLAWGVAGYQIAKERKWEHFKTAALLVTTALLAILVLGTLQDRFQIDGTGTALLQTGLGLMATASLVQAIMNDKKVRSHDFKYVG